MAFCKTVLLIDDDEIFNLVTENTLQQHNFADHVVVCQTAADALAFLKESAKKGKAYPDVIFLDINMPVMDGWDFLDSYRHFPEEVKIQAQLYMLSSSIDESDVLKSQQYQDVRDFIRKPLTKVNLDVLKFRIDCEK